MTKEEKILEIENLTTKLKDLKNLYLTDIAGLNAMETSALRRMCFKSGIKLSVVKNTLLERAMKDSGKDFGELSVLHEYTNLRKYRTNFITLITTILFYMFNKQNNYLNKFINYSLEKANKSSLKHIFKILARGY